METRTPPYKDVVIKDITRDDFKVNISGMVIKTKEGSFVIDDSTGEALVLGETSSDFVRVFGRVVPYENGFEIHAEIIQDYSTIDKELLKKTKELLRNKTALLKVSKKGE